MVIFWARSGVQIAAVIAACYFSCVYSSCCVTLSRRDALIQTRLLCDEIPRALFGLAAEAAVDHRSPLGKVQERGRRGALLIVRLTFFARLTNIDGLSLYEV